MTVPHSNPEFADIYGVATHVIPDAHDAPRRNVVVHSASDVVRMLGRTTRVRDYNPATDLLSGRDEACKLDREGMFTTRHQHGVFRRHFVNPRDCEFFGPLNAAAAAELRAFWDKQLGY